jgi:hypothetical protein
MRWRPWRPAPTPPTPPRACACAGGAAGSGASATATAGWAGGRAHTPRRVGWRREPAPSLRGLALPSPRTTGSVCMHSSQGGGAGMPRRAAPHSAGVASSRDARACERARIVPRCHSRPAEPAQPAQRCRLLPARWFMLLRGAVVAAGRAPGCHVTWRASLASQAPATIDPAPARTDARLCRAGLGRAGTIAQLAVHACTGRA